MVHLTCKTREDTYPITVERGSIPRVSEFFPCAEKKVAVIFDDGVPEEWRYAVLRQFPDAVALVFSAGEQNKTLQTAEHLWQNLLELGFTRHDCLIAVGGGVVTDITGFVASGYMRGMDYYSVPTTLLAQADASVGGKTAVNLNGIKNVVGAFYSPKGVLIDPDVLATLPPRHLSNGMAEIIKMAVGLDENLFSQLEKADTADVTEEMIAKAVSLKTAIVQQDETDRGIRQLLNLGHTVGHAIEAVSNGLYTHGECVAVGMLPFVSESLRKRLIPVLQKYGLPLSLHFDQQKATEAILHDKKSLSEKISVVVVPEAGQAVCRLVEWDTLLSVLQKGETIL